MGDDLVYRPGRGWIGQPAFSRDSVVRRTEGAEAFTSYVRNTYRVLLTRGLLGCLVYFTDEQTRSFMLSRLEGRALAAESV